MPLRPWYALAQPICKKALIRTFKCLLSPIGLFRYQCQMLREQQRDLEIEDTAVEIEMQIFAEHTYLQQHSVKWSKICKPRYSATLIQDLDWAYELIQGLFLHNTIVFLLYTKFSFSSNLLQCESLALQKICCFMGDLHYGREKTQVIPNQYAVMENEYGAPSK